MLTRSTLSVLKGIQQTINDTTDEDRFGQYVAAELKNIKATNLKARAKTQILKALLDAVLESEQETIVN